MLLLLIISRVEFFKRELASQVFREIVSKQYFFVFNYLYPVVYYLL